MGLSARDQQALDTIEGELASSDPELASALDTFSRLAAADDMPARERIREPRWRRRPRWPCKVVAVWLAITVALVVAALAARYAGRTGSCATWPAACATQRPPGVPRIAPSAGARN